MMKKFLSLVVLPAILVFSMSCSSKKTAPQVQALITAAQGTVEIALSGSADWIRVAPGQKIDAQTRIRTAAVSFCDLVIGGTHRCRIRSDSLVSLAEMTASSSAGGEQTVIDLVKGEVLTKASKLAKDASLRVTTPVAVVGVRGTEFLVTADADGNTRVAVAEGRVAFKPKIEIPADAAPETAELAAEVMIDPSQSSTLSAKTVEQAREAVAAPAVQPEALKQTAVKMRKEMATSAVTKADQAVLQEVSAIKTEIPAVPESAAEEQAEESTPVKPAFGQEWKLSSASAIGSGPTIMNGTLIHSLKGGIVRGVSFTGAKKWEYKAESEIVSGIGSGNGKVFFGTADGQLICLKAADGQLLWKKEIGVLASGVQPCFFGASVYVGNTVGEFRSINAETGVIDWSLSAQSGIYSSAAANTTTGMIYFASEDKNLYAVASQNGLKKWAFPTDNRIAGSAPIITPNGQILVGSYDGNLYAINADSSEAWKHSLGDRITSTALIQGDRVFVGAANGRFEAIDLKTGQTVWQATLPDKIEIQASAVGDKILVPCRNGSLYVLSRIDGKQLWVYAAGSKITTPPLVYGAGRAVIGSSAGTLAAVRLP
jgi:outer membrane protein assembly factor BamB